MRQVRHRTTAEADLRGAGRYVYCTSFPDPSRAAYGVLTEILGDQGHFLELAQNKYSRFLVNRVVESANKTQREILYKEFFGNVLTMIKHKVGPVILNGAHEIY